MKLMALRYAGICIQCGEHLAPRVEAWFDPRSKTVTCTTCKPTGTQLTADWSAPPD